MSCERTILTPEQAAERLQVRKSTVLEWLRSGKLKGSHLGYKTWRLTEADVDELLDSGREAQPAKITD